MAARTSEGKSQSKSESQYASRLSVSDLPTDVQALQQLLLQANVHLQIQGYALQRQEQALQIQ
jgi:hypothetical protein